MEEKLAQLCKENDVKGITQAIRSLKSSKVGVKIKRFCTSIQIEAVIYLLCYEKLLKRLGLA